MVAREMQVQFANLLVLNKTDLLGDAQVALARFDSMAAALSGPNVQLATLTGDTDPTLRLVWNRDRNLLLVAAQNLQNFAAEYKHNGKPFFVGLGFHKPHLPYAIFPLPPNIRPGCP